MLLHLKDEHFFKLSKCENVYVRHLLAKRSTLSVKKKQKKTGLINTNLDEMNFSLVSLLKVNYII